MLYYAHSLQEKPISEWQRLEVHLKNVAERASSYTSTFGSKNWGYISGLWHDLGKFSKEFQKKLKGETTLSVDHSTAGAQYAVKQYGKQYGKIIAYAIAGHHSGIPDGKSSSSSCLESRLKKKTPHLDFNAFSNFKKVSLENFPFLKNNKSHISPTIDSKTQKLLGFKLSFFIRLLYSSLVDADFLDTEEFLEPEKTRVRRNGEISQDLLKKLDTYLIRLKNSAIPSKINIKRNEILEHCKNAAELKPGFFSLTVPTGGGKTLSTLYFSLKHALKYGMRRVIYVIPYTSIIEQNAAIFKDVLGEDNVIEHHSNYDYNDNDNFNPEKLAAENWDAPIIVTTNVQFFESLFSNKYSKLRKLHNIVNSVVILDEAQMLPVELLVPTIEALKELVYTYKTTILFSTATQPALNKRDNFSFGIEKIKEIIPSPEELHRVFKRVSIELKDKMEDTEIIESLLKHKQALCIVNTRSHAHRLFDLLYTRNTVGAFHLSALMCPAHRREIIKRIKETLQSKKTCRVVSTQLVEAGVDFDFPYVYRAMAGLDSIIQAAGRCNREGKLKTGIVTVFKTDTKIPPGLLRQTADVTEEIFRNTDEIFSLDSINRFFSNLYWLQGDVLDRKKIMECHKDIVGLNFPFKEIAKSYRLIDSGYINLIIPYNDEARYLIDKLRYSNYSRGILRKLQQYIIQLSEYRFKDLVEGGVIEIIKNTYPVLIKEDLYDDNTGLWYEDGKEFNVEDLII